MSCLTEDATDTTFGDIFDMEVRRTKSGRYTKDNK